MSEEMTLSRDLALRIGQAARELPEMEVTQMVNALVRLLGAPLTADKLGGVTTAGLVKAGGLVHADGLAQAPQGRLEAACAALRGEHGAIVDDMPAPHPQAASLPEAVQVACASDSAGNLDGHFGSCTRFLVYRVSAEAVRLLDVRSIADVGLRGRRDDKNKARAALISDCQLLYCCSIGGPAAAKVVRAGVHPIKLPEGGDAAAIMEELRGRLADHPPPWLARLLGVPDGLEGRYPGAQADAVEPD